MLYLVTLPYVVIPITKFLITFTIFSIWPYFVRFDLNNRENDIYQKGLAHMERRAMAKTKGGRLALVPESSREGDVITLCKGGKVPLVLRNVPNSCEYQMIGECYVHKFVGSKVVWDEKLCRRLFVV